MKNPRAKDRGGYIDENSGIISQGIGNISKDLLGHTVSRIDVKHIDGAQRTKAYVEYAGNAAAGQVNIYTVFEIIPALRAAGNTCGNSDNNGKDMPQVGVAGKREKAVLHATGIKKSKDATQQPKIHEKCFHCPVDGFRYGKRKQKADIHRNAAQLEWEVPPVIGAWVYNISKAVLLPDFAEKQDDTKNKKNTVLSAHNKILAFFV